MAKRTDSTPQQTDLDLPPGRVRAAWRVLRGEAVVPAQIVAEWAEYQSIFNDLLQRFSAQLARQAKAEKDRVKRLSEAVEPQAEMRYGGSKAALRSRAADRLGLGALRPKLHQTDLLPPEGTN